jgi:hypothetical protein
MIRRIGLLTLALSLCAGPAVAQKVLLSGRPGPTGPLARFYMDVGLVSGTVVPAAARREGTGNRGFGLMLGLGLEFRSVVSLGVQATGQLFHDDSSFSQSTTGGTRSSSVGVFDVAAQAGLRLLSIPLSSAHQSRLVLGVGGGWSGFFGHRTIPNCVDCTEESLHFKSGGFVGPTIGIRTARGGARGRATEFIGSARLYGGGAEAKDMFVLMGRMFF